MSFQNGIARSFLSFAWLICIAASVVGCSSQKFGLESQSEAFGHIVSYNTEVDVLLVIDTSGSMAQHQESLAAQMPALVGALDQTKLDYRIAVTTMDMGRGGERGRFLKGPGMAPAVLGVGMNGLGDILSTRVRAGETGSTVERGLEAMKAALSGPNMEYDNADFLRKDSLLVVVFLTNEDDESVPDDYVGFLDSLKPPVGPLKDRGWIAHFIGVLPTDTSCKTARWNYRDPGFKYLALAQASGGRAESVCTADLRIAVDRIKARVIEIVTEYSLGDRKARDESIRVYINGDLLPRDATNGWTYNEDRNSIVFHGSGVPLPGSMIRVDFDPEGLK